MEKMTIQLGVVTTKNKGQIYRQDYMHPYVSDMLDDASRNKKRDLILVSFFSHNTVFEGYFLLK